MLRYEFRSGVTKQKRSNKLWVFVPLFVLLGGGYTFANLNAPNLHLPTDGPQDATARLLTTSKPNLAENRLYLPQINVDIAIKDGDSNDLLSSGAMHRNPSNGDPKQGGNFVVAANRFSLGISPFQTRAQSPLYHLGELQKGDQVYVDFEGVRYAYQVTQTYGAGTADSDVASRTSDSRLTLYSCDANNPDQIRDVIEAKPVGTVAWVNGVAKLKSPDEL
jgi:sortase A